MKRKANFNQETMSKKDLESYFTSIQERFNDVDERFDDIDERFNYMSKRFDKLEKIMESVLFIVKTYDIERKEVKSTLWEHDRRLVKLEKQLS